MQMLGRGTLFWNPMERIKTRYGSVVLSPKGIKTNIAKKFINKFVKIKCVVTKTRYCDHIGDLNLKIKPSIPNIGESIDIGTGYFYYDLDTIVLVPLDDREVFWLDPRKLYRLVGQDVVAYIEEHPEVETNTYLDVISALAN